VGVAVGEKNYRYFLGFLSYHVITFTYAAICMVQGIRSVCHEKRLWTATFVLADGSQELSSRVHVATYIVAEEPILAALLILTGVLAIFLGGFFVFHLSLVWRGMTTNEYYKWKDVRSYHSTMLKAHHAVLSLKENGALEGLPLQLGPIELGDITCDGSDDDEDSDAANSVKEDNDSSSNQQESSTEDSESDVDDNNHSIIRSSQTGSKQGGSSCGNDDSSRNKFEDRSSSRSSKCSINSSSSSNSDSDSDSDEQNYHHQKEQDGNLSAEGNNEDTSAVELERAAVLDRESSGALDNRKNNMRTRDVKKSNRVAPDKKSHLASNCNEADVADLREVRELVARRAGLDVKVCLVFLLRNNPKYSNPSEAECLTNPHYSLVLDGVIPQHFFVYCMYWY
jgi:hypothetical protein